MTEWIFEGTRLLSVSTNEKNLVFPKNITETANGDKTSSPFFACRGTVANISFEKESNIVFFGEYFFDSTTALRHVDLSNCLKLKNINRRVFFRSSVESVILPESGVLTDLLPGAFSSSRIKKIKIPDSMKQIHGYLDGYDGVFSYCGSLASIDISKNSNLENIGYAIGQLTILEYFFIPKKVTILAGGALNLMYSLSSIEVDKENNYYISIDNIIYNKDKTMLIFCACNKKTLINYEPTVIKIQSEAFRGCRRKEEFNVPNGVQELLINTFMQSLFPKVILPQTLLYIRSNAFRRTEFKSIKIPASVRIIEEQW